jgi:NADPH:quinone reductase-like Zn-dependent oxidoreductase
MRAWQVSELGEPRDVLRLVEVADPEPGPGQAVVRVLASPANFPDVLMCRGLYQVKPELPFTPGVELCGEVVAVGRDVTTVAVGARVLGASVLPYGGFGELAVMDAAQTFPAPPPSMTPRPPRSTSATRPAGSGCTGEPRCARVRPCWCTQPPAGSAAPRSSSGRRPGPG